MDKRKVFEAFVALAVALAFIVPISAVFANDEGTFIVQPVMSILPATQTKNVGNVFTVDVYINPEDYLISGANVDLLSFDPAVIQATDPVTFTSFFPQPKIQGFGTVDNVAGTITGIYELTVPFVGVGTEGTWLTIEFTAVDIGASPITMDIVGLPDQDGNKIDPITVNNGVVMVGEDTQPPVTTVDLDGIKGDNGWYISDVTANITATDGFSGVNYTMYNLDETGWTEYTNPFTVTTDGTHTVEYYSVDMAGNNESEPNWENLKSTSFKIDKTDPVTTHSLSGTMGNDGWYTSNVVVTLTASDVTSGINYTMYNLDGTGWIEYGSITVTTDGYHTVEYNSTDKAGNTEPTKSVSFKIDQTVETSCELDPPEPDGENDWYVSDVEVTLTATDDTSGINYTRYKLDENNWNEYTNPFTVTTDGTHTVEYYSVDMAGNNESEPNWENLKSTSFKIDKTDPVTTHSLSGTMGNNGWYTSNVVVTLTASDVTSEVNYTMYNLDETGWIEYGSITVTTDGYHTVEYNSTDKAGNTEPTKSVSFKIDQTAPETSCVLDPPEPDGENDWYVSDVEVTLTATDDTSGINYTMYNLDGTGWTEYGSITVTTDGPHTVEYNSTDNASNTEPTKSMDFKIDKTDPTIKLTWNKDDSKLVADVNDKTSGVAKVEFSVNGEYVGTATEDPYEWIVPNPKKGDKGQATVYDYAGNENISEEIDAVSQSQSKSSSSTPVQRAFLSNSESTVDSKLEDTSADSITDAKPNEITVDPESELDVGLKNSSPLLFFKRALIKK